MNTYTGKNLRCLFSQGTCNIFDKPALCKSIQFSSCSSSLPFGPNGGGTVDKQGTMTTAAKINMQASFCTSNCQNCNSSNQSDCHRRTYNRRSASNFIFNDWANGLEQDWMHPSEVETYIRRDQIRFEYKYTVYKLVKTLHWIHLHCTIIDQLSLIDTLSPLKSG